MNVAGIGTDLIEIQRIRQAVEKNPRILERLFTAREQEDYRDRGSRWEVLAGKFAAKEAVVKAMGTGVRGFSWTDVEILPDASGKPHVFLRGDAVLISTGLGIRSILITLSHNRTSAVAFAIALAGEVTP